MQMIEVVPMDFKHLNAVHAIEVDSFSIPWSHGDLEKELKNSMAIYLVALNNREVVGYVGMWHVVTEGHITNIAVAPSQRGRGVARALLDELICIAREKQMIGLTLEVRISNIRAQRLYTGYGFKPEGFRKNYYEDTKEDAIIMWKYF